MGAVIGKSRFANLPAYLGANLTHVNRPLEILSLASGYCGHELDLARQMSRPYNLTCTELNESIFEKAKVVAENEKLSITFKLLTLISSQSSLNNSISSSHTPRFIT